MNKEAILVDEQTIAEKINGLQKAKQHPVSDYKMMGDCACETSSLESDCVCEKD